VRDRLQPGDVGAIAALHGTEYAREYGLDITFEADVAHGVADLAAALVDDPEAGRAWLAEDEQGLRGCIAITRERPDHGRLRWFLVAARARGSGLGRLLLDAALDYSRGRFATLELSTFSELTAAAGMYLAAGFELRDSVPRRLWGREIELRHYDLRF
jgi:GNAT superfamily N-acetyltransferase